MGLGLALQLARTQLEEEKPETDQLLSEANEELRAALEELRELARGLHPAILTEQGLDAAIRMLAERAPVPVTVEAIPDERLPAQVEAAAYYVVSEALANVAKYANASLVSVSIATSNGQAIVIVEDDGAGGADVQKGSGLRGLADRVEALDDQLDIESSPGSGTQIHAEIPCA